MTTITEQQTAPQSGQALGPRVRIGSLWEVFNNSERYLARVEGYNPDRVLIRRVVASNITATPTLALWSMFTNRAGGYTLFKEAP